MTGTPTAGALELLADAPEFAPLEATVAKLTARAPDKLFGTDDARARERFGRELERQLASFEDGSYEGDANRYLDEFVFDAETGVEDIVVTDAYPRDAGMASGLYQALSVLRLPSGASVYYDRGEMESHSLRCVSAGDSDDEAAAAFGQIVGLPTYFHAGGDLVEIDRHLSECTQGGWFLESLLDSEASWIDHPELAEGEERRGQLQTAIDESWDEGDADDKQLDHAQEVLDATPGWFLRLGDRELCHVASYAVPGDDHVPRLRHKFHPWTKPTPEMFLHPADRANLQHIVAAYLLAR